MRAGKLFVKERGWGLQKHMQEKVMSEKIVFRIQLRYWPWTEAFYQQGKQIIGVYVQVG